jgi:hypothetical protein
VEAAGDAKPPKQPASTRGKYKIPPKIPLITQIHPPSLQQLVQHHLRSLRKQRLVA